VHRLPLLRSSDSCHSILPCRAFIIVTSNLLWSFLVYSSPPVLHLVINVDPSLTKHRSSFARALNIVVDVPLSLLREPCIKGDLLSIKIYGWKMLKQITWQSNAADGVYIPKTERSSI